MTCAGLSPKIGATLFTAAVAVYVAAGPFLLPRPADPPRDDCPDCNRADREANRAASLQRAGDFAGAADRYTAAIEAGADPESLLAERAYCRFRVGDDAGALADADRLTKDFGSARGWTIKGFVEERAGDVGKARTDYRLGMLHGDKAAAVHLRRAGG